MINGERGDESNHATQHGWRVHGLLDNWTGKIDNKASIALAIESAAFAFAVTQTDAREQFAGLGGSSLCWFRVGLGLLLLSILFALIVVMPQLKHRASKKDWQTNTIYFGHLRHWEPADLVAAMSAGKTEPEQLARQMIAMSKIAWRKHVWLQVSLGAFAVGAAILVSVAATS